MNFEVGGRREIEHLRHSTTYATTYVMRSAEADLQTGGRFTRQLSLSLRIMLHHCTSILFLLGQQRLGESKGMVPQLPLFDTAPLDSLLKLDGWGRQDEVMK